MVTTKLNLSMTEPQVRQIYAKQGDTGRVLDIALDQTPEDGTLRILRPDGTEVTSEAVTGGEVESGSTFDSLTEADVTELTVGIEPVQDLSHGDPSPTNICPITGHDEVTVKDEGKNLLNLNVTSKTQNGITFTVYTDGSIKVNGTATGSISLNGTTGAPPKITKGTTVTLSGVEGFTTNQMYLQLIYTGADGSTISIVNTASPTTYTFTQDATFASFWLAVRPNATINNAMVYPQLELGSTATAYEPYQGSTYTTSLGQTVYGGTLDMVSGVLTVDRAEYKLSDMTATLESNNRWFFTSLQSVIKIPSSTSVATTTISDRFVAMSNVEMANTTNIGLSVNGQGNLIVRNGSSTDQPTGQIVIPLATPVEYQLTAQQIKTLVGTNNVWASSGDIVNITFTYGGLLSELPSEATEIVGKCCCDVEQNGVSSMPFTLNVKKNERES